MKSKKSYSPDVILSTSPLLVPLRSKYKQGGSKGELPGWRKLGSKSPELKVTSMEPFRVKQFKDYYSPLMFATEQRLPRIPTAKPIKNRKSFNKGGKIGKVISLKEFSNIQYLDGEKRERRAKISISMAEDGEHSLDNDETEMGALFSHRSLFDTRGKTENNLKKGSNDIKESLRAFTVVSTVPEYENPLEVFREIESREKVVSSKAHTPKVYLASKEKAKVLVNKKQNIVVNESEFKSKAKKQFESIKKVSPQKKQPINRVNSLKATLDTKIIRNDAKEKLITQGYIQLSDSEEIIKEDKVSVKSVKTELEEIRAIINSDNVNVITSKQQLTNLIVDKPIETHEKHRISIEKHTESDSESIKSSESLAEDIIIEKIKRKVEQERKRLTNFVEAEDDEEGRNNEYEEKFYEDNSILNPRESESRSSYDPTSKHEYKESYKRRAVYTERTETNSNKNLLSPYSLKSSHTLKPDGHRDLFRQQKETPVKNALDNSFKLLNPFPAQTLTPKPQMLNSPKEIQYLLPPTPTQEFNFVRKTTERKLKSSKFLNPDSIKEDREFIRRSNTKTHTQQPPKDEILQNQEVKPEFIKSPTMKSGKLTKQVTGIEKDSKRSMTNNEKPKITPREKSKTYQVSPNKKSGKRGKGKNKKAESESSSVDAKEFKVSINIIEAPKLPEDSSSQYEELKNNSEISEEKAVEGTRNSANNSRFKAKRNNNVTENSEILSRNNSREQPRKFDSKSIENRTRVPKKRKPTFKTPTFTEDHTQPSAKETPNQGQNYNEEEDEDLSDISDVASDLSKYSVIKQIELDQKYLRKKENASSVKKSNRTSLVGMKFLRNFIIGEIKKNVRTMDPATNFIFNFSYSILKCVNNLIKVTNMTRFTGKNRLKRKRNKANREEIFDKEDLADGKLKINKKPTDKKVPTAKNSVIIPTKSVSPEKRGTISPTFYSREVALKNMNSHKRSSRTRPPKLEKSLKAEKSQKDDYISDSDSESSESSSYATIFPDNPSKRSLLYELSHQEMTLEIAKVLLKQQSLTKRSDQESLEDSIGSYDSSNDKISEYENNLDLEDEIQMLASKLKHNPDQFAFSPNINFKFLKQNPLLYDFKELIDGNYEIDLENLQRQSYKRRFIELKALENQFQPKNTNLVICPQEELTEDQQYRLRVQKAKLFNKKKKLKRAPDTDP